MGCMYNLKRNFCIQVLVFLVIFAVDFADLLSDWLFYNDMRLQEKGLVFGPIDTTLLYILLGFSCAGVVTFLVEIINFGREIFRPDEKAWIDVDYLSAFTVWFEEIPQISISVIIAGCREEGVSIYQIVKASIVIISCVGRLLISVIRYCLRKRRDDYKNRKTFKCCSGLLMLGLILSILGSALVFAFSHVLRDGDVIRFQEPKEFVLTQRDTSKYYPHVGIYLNANQLRNGQDQMYVRDEWIKLLDLTDLEKSPYPAQKIKFKKNGNMKIQIQTSLTRDYGNIQTRSMRTECYNETNGWFVSRSNQCSKLFHPTDSTAEYVLYFNFIKQSSYLFMGDVKYNARYTESGECFNDRGNHTQVHLKYFKANTHTEDRFHLLLPNGGVFKTLLKFYTSEDLVSIKDAWKTGFVGCQSSGSESPNWDKNIRVKCLNT
jgi:hypothetical protein